MFVKINNFFKAFLLSGMLLALGGCHIFDFRPDDQLLARAYDSRLYLEDIRGMIPPGTGPEDSTAFVKRYVHNWISDQAFLHHARQSIDYDAMSIEQRVKEYRDALIMHQYEVYLVGNEMDTLITEEELQAFYQENEAYFTLKDHIVNVTYIKLPLQSREAGRVRSMYRSSDPETLEDLEELGLQHAATYYIGKENWMLFSDILNDMPLTVNDPAVFLRNNRFAEITDDYFRYFLYIHEFRLKGELSPLAFERDNLRRFIMNHNKKQFIQEKRRALFNEAVESKHIETFL